MTGYAERGRDLLESDDQGDPHGEAEDHRQRDVAHVAPGPGVGEHEQEDAGHEAHDQHRGRPELRHDGHEHHGHGAGRTGDLQVAAAEGSRDRTCNHRSHETGAGAEPRGDAEGQRERQSHDRDRQTREEVATRVATDRTPLRTPRQDRAQPRTDLSELGCLRTHARLVPRSSLPRRPCSSATARKIARPAWSRSLTSGTITL